MPSVTVPVLQPLTYQGRSYVPGQRVTMRPIDALAAGRAGTVSLTKPATGYATRDMTAEASAVESPPSRRRRRGRSTYQRRDMRAEEPTR